MNRRVLGPVVAMVVLAFSMTGLASTPAPFDPAEFVEAVSASDAAAVADFLERGADPNTIDQYDTPVLSIASWNGDEEIVRLLLDAGASPRARKGDRGKSSLMVATERNRLELVRLLLEAGADLNLRDGNDWSALTYAIYFADDSDIAKYLIDSGADVTWVEPGDCPGCHRQTDLIRAAQNGRKDIVPYMLDAGADLYAVNEEGESVIYWAQGPEGNRDVTEWWWLADYLAEDLVDAIGGGDDELAQRAVRGGWALGCKELLFETAFELAGDNAEVIAKLEEYAAAK